MVYRSLRAFIEALDKANELIRIKSYVNPELEITEITDRISKLPGGGKAILFENTGTGFPVITNMMGSEKRICMALGTEDLDRFGQDIQELFQKITKEKSGLIEKLGMLPVLSQIASWMPEVSTKKAPCQEVILKDVDLNILPVLKCWPYDGGKFVTLPMVHTKDPETGARNIGMYRMQVVDAVTTGMHWQIHKTGARHFEKYKKLGKKMPVAVALGGDPVYTYSATAPLPEGIDEYLLAGFLRKQKVKLVKCITQDLEVPADADFIIEGYVDPEEQLFWEGPFGDHTGFYSLEDWYPKFHVTCITHRKDACYPATIVGIPPQEDAYFAKATERIFVQPIKKSMLPEMIDMDLPYSGVAHNLSLISIEQKYPAQAIKVFNSLWGAGQMMLNKIMVVVDDGVDVHDYDAVLKEIARNVSFPEDVLISRGPADVLDHASHHFAFGGKLGIDATSKAIPSQTQPGSSHLDRNELERVMKSVFQEGQQKWLYVEDRFPVLIAKISENKSNEIRVLAHSICEMEIPIQPKVILWLDVDLDLNDLFSVMWFALGAVDPARDCWFETSKLNGSNTFHVDATIKTLTKDNFKRPWPNPVLMSSVVIGQIDKKWKEYVDIDFIPSPSLNYSKAKIEESPIAYHNTRQKD